MHSMYEFTATKIKKQDVKTPYGEFFITDGYVIMNLEGEVFMAMEKEQFESFASWVTDVEVPKPETVTGDTPEEPEDFPEDEDETTDE